MQVFGFIYFFDLYTALPPPIRWPFPAVQRLTAPASLRLGASPEPRRRQKLA